MQRLADPLVRFKTWEEIEQFMNMKSGIWKKDNSGTLMNEGSMDQNIDHILSKIGYNTRVLIVFSDPNDHSAEFA